MQKAMYASAVLIRFFNMCAHICIHWSSPDDVQHVKVCNFFLNSFSLTFPDTQTHCLLLLACISYYTGCDLFSFSSLQSCWCWPSIKQSHFKLDFSLWRQLFQCKQTLSMKSCCELGVVGWKSTQPLDNIRRLLIVYFHHTDIYALYENRFPLCVLFLIFFCFFIFLAYRHTGKKW